MCLQSISSGDRDRVGSVVWNVTQGLLSVLCNNQGAITLLKDNKFHSRTKHIDLHYHFIREAVDEGR